MIWLELVLLATGGVTGMTLAHWARLPIWPLTGGILGGAGAHLLVPGSSLPVPHWWSVTAQILIGAVVGSGIARGVLRDFVSMLAPAVLAVVTIIGTGVLGGLVIAQDDQIDTVVAVLGTVPGGVGEMVATAETLNADSAVVAGMHVVRLVLMLTCLSWLVTLVEHLTKRRRPGTADLEK